MQKNFTANTTDCNSLSVCSTEFLTANEAWYRVYLRATNIFGHATPTFYYPNTIGKQYYTNLYNNYVLVCNNDRGTRQPSNFST